VRAQKLVGSIPTYYIAGVGGKTEVIATSTQTAPTYNTWAEVENVGQVRRNGTTLTRYYYVKDHLGDIRMTVASSGTVDSYFDYYPFGQLMDGRTSVASADSRYKYTGKERDAESGYDCFGARYYDARIGRFLSVDHHLSSYPSLSPYCYVGNNPIGFVDPTGMDRDSTEAKDPKPDDKKADTYVLPFPIDMPVPSWLTSLLGKLSLVFWTATTFPGDAPHQIDASQAKDASNEGDGNAEQTKPEVKDKNVTDSVGKIAKTLGKSVDNVKQAIERAKQDNLDRGGSKRNPDVKVDIGTGEIYPIGPGGKLGDSIGNIHDYLK
jgi:RHS repeat-associated protein